ncbi:MAG: lipid II flippase family protein [bacterium JZ-2024 1]
MWLFDRSVVMAGIFLCIMAMIDTLGLSTRVSGVLTGRLALSLSLFNVIILAARLSNLLQAPIVGSMADFAIRENLPSSWMLARIRVLIGFSTLGVFLGAFFTPWFVRVFILVMNRYEEKKTVWRTFLSFLPPGQWRNLIGCFQLPTYEGFFAYYRYFKRLPMDVLVWHILVTGFYTVGVLSTIFAAVLKPELRATAIQLSGIVNGVATFLLFLIVDPPAAHITDQCIQKKRPQEDIFALNLFLITTKFLGTLLAQLLIVLMGHFVVWVSRGIFSFFWHG